MRAPFKDIKRDRCLVPCRPRSAEHETSYRPQPRSQGSEVSRLLRLSSWPFTLERSDSTRATPSSKTGARASGLVRAPFALMRPARTASSSVVTPKAFASWQTVVKRSCLRSPLSIWLTAAGSRRAARARAARDYPTSSLSSRIARPKDFATPAPLTAERAIIQEF
jgi:hypothetical protein